MCNTTHFNPTRFDNAKAEAFAYKLMNVLNSGGLAFLISIGHRTRLFDVLSTLEPSSSDRIAAEAGLNERYVREWLNGLVAGQILTFDPENKTYALPAEHAAFLTREASPDNIGVTAQYFAVLGGVEDDIVDCFHKGGGVPYEKFSRFHEVMAEESAQTTVAGLFDAILPLVSGIDEKLQQGIDVVDIGCGRGRALIAMARQYPNSRFVGYDLSTEAIEFGSETARTEGLTNVRFESKDLTYWDEADRFDLVTGFDVIHDQGNPDVVLQNIHRALRPGGVFLMQDIYASSHVHNNIEHPLGPFLYTISTMHCMTVSLAQGGKGLGTVWGEELALEMLAEAGFEKVRVSRLEHDIQNNYYVAYPTEARNRKVA